MDPSFDVFISHASEDKAEVARPLTEALRRHGISVWLDEDEIQLGDSLQRVLDRGLRAARFGIVILSPTYFRKAWTQNELGALLAMEVEAGRTVVLPVRHGVGQQDVVRYAPMLADRIGVETSAGIDHVAKKVVAALRRAIPASSQSLSIPAIPVALAAAAEDRLLRAVPLELLLRQQEPIPLAQSADGGARCLAVALGDRLVVGRAYAGQLHSRAAEALQRRGHQRVHWVTHWDDTALNQLSVELHYRRTAGRSHLAIENLTGYGSRQNAIEIIDPAGRSRQLPAGERLELPVGEGTGTWVLVLGSGTSSQRLLHLVHEPVLCGGATVPVLRSETLFWVPPGDPAAQRVQFFGIWLPPAAGELVELLEKQGADLVVRFGQSPLALTFFVDPQAGAMVVGDEDLEQALGLT